MTVAYPLSWPVDPSTGLPIPITDSNLAVASSTRSGGQSTSGVEQTVVSPAARWEGTITARIVGSGAMLAWRGFIAALAGRLGTFLLPSLEFGAQPWARSQFGVVQHPGVTDAPPVAVTADDAPANATQLSLTVASGAALVPGHRFSLGGHLHEIQAASTADGILYQVDVHPWLREAVVGPAACEFARPLCLVRLKTDGEGALQVSGSRITAPTLAVVEAF